jgi:hypothetical protein
MWLWARHLTHTFMALLRRAASLLLASINIGLLTEARQAHLHLKFALRTVFETASWPCSSLG